MGQVNLERNSFVKGLITEASALTFPENASIEEDNFLLNREGSRQRRLGMDYEDLQTIIDTTKAPLVFDNAAINTFRWDNVNNNATLSFGVVQVGADLWFVDLYAQTLSDNVKNSGAPYILNTDTIGYTISGNEKLNFSAINGHLVVVGKELTSPLYIGYDIGSDSFFLRAIDIKVRDIWGVYDTLEADDRPSTLTDAHKYNLKNQGYPNSRISAQYPASGTGDVLKDRYPFAYDSSGVVITYPTLEFSINKTEAAIVVDQYGTNGNATVPSGGGSSYPSNADLVSIGKTSTGGFDHTLIEGSYLGTTPAPKGRFIIDAFDRGASRREKAGVTNLTNDSDTGTISTVATYANRVFYSGIDSSVVDPMSVSPNYTGTVFFTQTAETLSQLGKCYQEADPSSEDIPDLVDTDGGTIKISGASNVLALVSTSTSIVVIAENGVWEITGPDGVFKATDFSINRITNVGAVNAGCVVDAEGTILYWSDGGIYRLIPDQVSGKLTAENITQTTIQTLYNNIPSVAKANVLSTYDPASRQIKWMYNDNDDYDGITLKNKYNRELTLDVVLLAFSTNTIGELNGDSPFIAGYVTTQNFNTSDDIQNLVVNGEQVQVNGEDVIVTQTVRSRGISQTKYLTFVPNGGVDTNYGMTFSHYVQDDFRDWFSVDNTGVDAPAYLVTGYELFADSQRRKQVTYLTTHFKRTESGFTDVGGGQLEFTNPSGCLVRGQWDFANSSASGKYGTQFQAYRLHRLYIPDGESDPFDYGTVVITTKSKLRGSGRAIGLRFDTETGKDCYILGWAMNVEGQRHV